MDENTMTAADIRITESPSRFREGLLIETHGFRHERMLDGEAVSSLLVADYRMRIGIADVSMGGIVSVGTKEGHRNRGYSRQVIQNSIAWMEAHSYDCSILFGIDNFYHKFGYAVCLPECRIEVKTRDAETAPPALTVRPFAAADAPSLHALYAGNNGALTGSFVRGPDYHWFRKGSGYFVRPEAVVFTDAAGDIVAYAARDLSADHVTVCEMGARQPEHCAVILRWAAGLAIERRLETVAFLAPPDSVFAEAVSAYGARQTITLPRNGSGGGQILGMGRLVRLRPFFERTLPEWTRRAATARSLSRGASARLETDIGALTLRWSGDAVEIDAEAPAAGCVRLPQWRLMQLAMGYHSAEVALSFPEVQGSGALDLFHALFQRRPGYLYKTDQF